MSWITPSARTRGRLTVLLPLTAAVAAAFPAGASALTIPSSDVRAIPHSALSSHGQTLHAARADTNQSGNWFGYDQGTLEQGGKLFTSVAGYWTVPTATLHTAGQDEASSTWVGIGGGCVDSGCLVGDNTLIQTGTEQDVSGSGSQTYYAWWEIIPAPSLEITSMKVAPGDLMYASVAEVVPYSNLWTITIKDTTRNEVYSVTVPYTSSHATAEWIEETPLQIGTNAGFSALPNLTSAHFDSSTANGAPAGLKSSEEIQLTDSTGKVIGVPSAPDTDADGFETCAWATSCSSFSS